MNTKLVALLSKQDWQCSSGILKYLASSGKNGRKKFTGVQACQHAGCATNTPIYTSLAAAAGDLS